MVLFDMKVAKYKEESKSMHYYSYHLYFPKIYWVLLQQAHNVSVLMDAPTPLDTAHLYAWDPPEMCRVKKCSETNIRSSTYTE